MLKIIFSELLFLELSNKCMKFAKFTDFVKDNHSQICVCVYVFLNQL